MTDQTSSPFSTIDATLGQIKADHAASMRALQDSLTAAGIETALAKDQLKTAVEKRIEAEQRTAALQAFFAVIRHVLDEADAVDIHTVQMTAQTPLPRNNLDNRDSEHG